MKPRSTRRKVMLGARMRCGATWNDASILNVSGTGLGLAAAMTPRPGAYIELRRGAYVIVARVVWANGQRFGVRAQDGIAVDELVAAVASAGPASALAAAPRSDRRSLWRPGEREAANRALSRWAEFCLIGVFGAALALAAFQAASGALGTPLGQVSAALDPK